VIKPKNTTLDAICISHRCIKENAFILFTNHIHASKAQACPSTENNKSLLLLLFSILLQHEPSYLSDAAEIQDITEALSYRVLLSSPKLSHSSKTTALPAIWSTSLLSVLSSTLPKNCLSTSVQTSDPSSSKGPLLLPEASPKRSMLIQSDLESAVSPS